MFGKKNKTRKTKKQYNQSIDYNLQTDHGVEWTPLWQIELKILSFINMGGGF